MANADVVNAIIDMTLGAMTYLLPVIGVMAGINFIISMLFYTMFKTPNRAFRG